MKKILPIALMLLGLVFVGAGIYTVGVGLALGGLAIPALARRVHVDPVAAPHPTS